MISIVAPSHSTIRPILATRAPGTRCSGGASMGSKPVPVGEREDRLGIDGIAVDCDDQIGTADARET